MVISRLRTICAGGSGPWAGRGGAGGAASLPAAATTVGRAAPPASASCPSALVSAVGTVPPGGAGDQPRSATGAGSWVGGSPDSGGRPPAPPAIAVPGAPAPLTGASTQPLSFRSEEHTSELQSR